MSNAAVTFICPVVLQGSESAAPVNVPSKQKQLEVPPLSEHCQQSSQQKQILRKDYSRFFFEDESLEKEHSGEFCPEDQADSS
jgi:hypothetical protein